MIQKGCPLFHAVVLPYVSVCLCDVILRIKAESMYDRKIKFLSPCFYFSFDKTDSSSVLLGI